MHNESMNFADRWGRSVFLVAAVGLLAVGCSSASEADSQSESTVAGQSQSSPATEDQGQTPSGVAAGQPEGSGAGDPAGSAAGSSGGAGSSGAGGSSGASDVAGSGGQSPGGGGGSATTPGGSGKPAETTAPQPGVPGAPGKPSTRLEGNVLSASWSAPSGSVPVTEYRAFAFDAEGLPVAQCNAAAPAVDCAFESIPPGRYTVKVRAISGNLAGPPSQASDVVEVR